jgi:hypothetical protein
MRRLLLHLRATGPKHSSRLPCRVVLVDGGKGPRALDSGSRVEYSYAMFILRFEKEK